MALTGNVSDLFWDDYNAAFNKLERAFPISTGKRILSRYISGIGFTFVGFFVSMLLALVISILTPIIHFGECFSYLLLFWGIIVIYLSLLTLMASGIRSLIFKAAAGSNMGASLVTLMEMMMLPWFSFILLIVGIELPFYLCLGSKQGTTAKTSIILLFVFCITGWVFFGDISILKDFDLVKIIKWLEAHTALLL